MNIKRVYTLFAVVSLAVGAVLYFLFRPHTLFLSWFSVSAPLSQCSFPGDIIVRYYLPDSLWCYALCFSLFRLYLPQKRGAVWISLTALAFGCLWEGLQYIGCVPGTGDILDCVAYGVGSISALCIYFLTKRRKKLWKNHSHSFWPSRCSSCLRS